MTLIEAIELEVEDILDDLLPTNVRVSAGIDTFVLAEQVTEGVAALILEQFEA